jgi:hypothetical protein
VLRFPVKSKERIADGEDVRTHSNCGISGSLETSLMESVCILEISNTEHIR